jgi:hypothetical protein
MTRVLDLKNYDKVLSAFHRLCEAMPTLIEQSGLKHRQIYEHPALKASQIKMGKDTFYRRLNTNQWTPEELSAILPMVIEGIKKNNKDFYREFKMTLNETLDVRQET